MFNFWCKIRLKVVALKYLTEVTSCKKYHKLSYIHRIGKEPLRPLTIGQLLEQKCNEYSERTALISRHQNKKLNFHDVLEKSDRLAAGFRKIGLNRGDKVGIWAPNMVEWYLTHMACARAGLVLVCINHALQQKEIEYCINKVGMKAIVCTDEFKTQKYYDILNNMAPEISNSDPGKLKSRATPCLESVIIATEDNLKFRGAYNFDEILDIATLDDIQDIKSNQHLIQPDDMCHIQFTSGTTGKPKAPIATHFNLVNNSYQFGARSSIHKKDHRLCCMVPFFHVFGTDGTICNTLNHGATLVIPAPSFSAAKSLDAIVEEKCTCVHGTPTMYIDLLEQQKRRQENLNQLDYILVGAAPTTPQLIRDLEEHLKVKKINVGYGMSECTSATFQSLPEDSNHVSVDTVGVLVDHLEAKVVDENGRIVPRGVPGELCIRGFTTTIGYWDDEEKTREMISKDRWLRTGDKFIIREDGYGVIVGRLKDMILRGGENIYPKEIEELLTSHPAVLECHVIGLPHERLGEEVCACVRLAEGATLTLMEVQQFCKSHLAKFKIPSVLKVVEGYPKTASGKIQKFKLVEMFSTKK